MASRGRGRRGSGRSQSGFDLIYNFDLFTLRADGETPTTFDGAIENFTGFFEENTGVADDTFVFSDDTQIDIDFQNNPQAFNLQPRFLSAGDQLLSMAAR